MPEQATLPSLEKIPSLEKKQRRSRRNYAGEVAALQAYCQAAADVIKAHLQTEYGKGMVAAYDNVLSQLGGKRGR